jgi:hypothetical protein
MKASVVVPFLCASVAILVMNNFFEGGFQIGRVLISFGLYLAFKGIFKLATSKEVFNENK